MPAIDGLRAISILLVLYGHLSLGSFPKFMRAATLGRCGVVIFFAISGFLITSQLMSEQRRSGRIDWPRFFCRRALRLMPAMLGFLLFVVCLSHWGLAVVTATDMIHALTYTMDYYLPHTATLEHLWSLAVEEQFYLIWPVAVLVLSWRNLNRVTWLCIVVCPILRWIGWHFGIALPPRRFEMTADALAIGCLLALQRDRLQRLPKVMRSSLASFCCFAVIIGCAFLTKKYSIFPVFGISIESLCAALIICALVTNPTSLVARILSLGPVVWLGTISYSLYLWQQPFLLPSSPTMIAPLPFGLLAAATAAVLSFYVVERPIREWGKRQLQRRQPRSATTLPTVAVTVE